MIRALTLMVVVASGVGCGSAKPEAAPVAKQLADLQAHADKVVSQLDKDKAAEEKLKRDLAADPSPVAALALAQARKGFTESFGDDAVAAATITVDTKSIKTFGGEKWAVQGLYDGKDGGGEMQKTRWISTIQLMFGKLQVLSTRHEHAE